MFFVTQGKVAIFVDSTDKFCESVIDRPLEEQKLNKKGAKTKMNKSSKP
jgi:hypothetical protein